MRTLDTLGCLLPCLAQGGRCILTYAGMSSVSSTGVPPSEAQAVLHCGAQAGSITLILDGAEEQLRQEPFTPGAFDAVIR